MERQKDLLLEEIVELKDTIYDAFDALNKREKIVVELRNKVRGKEAAAYTSPSFEEYVSTI